MKAMSRPIEASVSRDWSFGFVTWNYLFRYTVNLSRPIYAYERKHGKDTGANFTPTSLEKGAIQIATALWAKYKDVNGQSKSVGGDMTKVRYVSGLSDAAHVLLKNIEHTSRKLPGTQETRRLMRFATQAYRIRYGNAIFVTFSPDESHNLLMIRLSRTRRNDPVWQSRTAGPLRRHAERDSSDLNVGPDDQMLCVSVEEMYNSLPYYDERRIILATDALASVDGFRVMVQLTWQHLFGMNFCQSCRHCNIPSNPCQDMFGSNATSEGGIFGRVDAVYTSIEAQKSTGSMHAHSQVFVQCLHQHTCLWEIVQKLRAKPGDIVREYFDYKTHVSRQVYNNNRNEVDTKLDDLESVWPEYKEATCLSCFPSYLNDAPYDPTAAHVADDMGSMLSEGKQWLQTDLSEDVEQLQMMKQHHVHLRNPETNVREPLAACRRKDNPTECKANFPRN